jgi:peptidoglycan/LPS O-acetylase OafA/YrhL
VLIVGGSDKNLLYRSIFANKILIPIGILSFGIYLSHPTLMHWLEQGGFSIADPFLRFVVIAGMASIVSLLTYFLVERPGLVLGSKVGRLLIKKLGYSIAG